MHAYFLSQNQASDVSIALSCDDCPNALRILYRAMWHVSTEVRPLLSHPKVFTNIAPAPIKAYSILATAAAKVAREYWQAKQDAGHRADCPCTWCKRKAERVA